MTDEAFEKIVAGAIDALPEKYGKALENVAFFIEDEPSPEQRRKLNLRCHTMLFGLYEGVPRTVRGRGYSGVLPDKITIFKQPILMYCGEDPERIKKQAHRTVWHEVAHHYGLNHDDIHKLEKTLLN